MKKINENTKVTLTLGQLKRLVKESFDDEAPEVAYTVRNNTRTFSNSDQPKEYGTYRTEEDAEKMRHWLARKDPSWRLENTEVVPKELDPMLPIHWTNVDGLEDDEGGPLVENGRGLVDQVLEDPQVQSRAEQFINALIEYAVEYDEYDYPAGGNVTRSDEMRWEDLVKAVKVVVARYKGAK